MQVIFPKHKYTIFPIIKVQNIILSKLSTLNINKADTNINDSKNTIYLIQPSFFLSFLGILYGNKSRTIPVQQA